MGKFQLRLTKPHEIACEELRAQASADGTDRTLVYVAWEGMSEVGIFCIDLVMKPCDLHLALVYVLRDRRHAGVGTYLVAQVEVVARRRRYEAIALRVGSEPGSDDQYLCRWYEGQGYSRTNPDSNEFRKVLEPRTRGGKGAKSGTGAPGSGHILGNDPARLA